MPINWEHNDLPPGSARWGRQLQTQLDSARTDLDRLFQSVNITNRANASTSQSLSQQIQAIEAQQVALAQAQANIVTAQNNIVAAQNYTTSLAQVYANGSNSTDSGWASGGFSTSSGIRISVTVPIVTGRVVIELNGTLAAAALTFSCPALGLTQTTALTLGTGNSIYTGLANTVTTGQIGATRRTFVGGLTIGSNATFTLEAYSYNTTSSVIRYPSISVQNVGLD